MNGLKIVASFVVCGAGQLLYGRLRRGFFFMLCFFFSLGFGLYRLYFDEIITSILFANEISIKISFFYLGLAALVWIYNLVDIFEMSSQIKDLSKVDHYEEGRVASLTGDYLKAKDEFEKALKFNKKDKDALFQLGRVYLNLGMKNKAKKMFDTYVSSGEKKWLNEIDELMGSI